MCLSNTRARANKGNNMRYKLPDNRVVQDDQSFDIAMTITIPAQGDIDPDSGNFVEIVPAYEELQTVQFPNGVRGLSADQISQYGIEPIVEMPRPDDRFYMISENADNPGEYDAIPRDVAGLIAAEITAIKQAAASLLGQTDWEITRALERGDPIAQELRDYRANVRAYSNVLETTISAFDFHEFEDWKLNGAAMWPVRQS